MGRCVTPPHPSHAASGRDNPDVLVTAGRSLAGAYGWLRTKGPERGPLPAGAGVYAAGGITHAADLSALTLAPLAAGAAGATYGIVAHRSGDPQKASKASAAVAASGAWTSVAAEAGLLAGPYAAVSWSWAALFGLGYAIYRADAGIKARIEWREAKAYWHELAGKLGMAGSHLLSREETRLGDALVIDTTGTGKRASQFGDDLAERFAELEHLPPSRVRVKPDRIAGRIRISIRRQDPWANPSPHPLLDEDPEVQLPAQADITKPLPVGLDPETGRPLPMEVFTEDGAVNTVVVAIKGGGKTVLLNNLLERLTSSPSELVIAIDVSKGKDLKRWRDAGALGPSALGADERGKAVKILAAVEAMIKHRAGINPDAVFQPQPGQPKVTVVIDEIDALMGAGDGLAQAAQNHLTYIASKGRSEAVGVIVCGQRGTAQWLGGADLRALFDQFVIGKVNRSGEAGHAAGDLGLRMPDMGSYGEGHGGVMAIASIGGSDVDLGRTFKLKEFADIDKLAAGRRPSEIEPALAEYLGDKWTSLHDGQQAAQVQASPTPQVGDSTSQGRSLTVLDEDLEESMPDDIKDSLSRLRASHARNQETWDYLNSLETPPEPSEAVQQEMARRRAEADYSTTIPDESRALLIEEARDGGTTRGELMETLNASKSTVFRFLSRLKQEGVIEQRGRGRGARWHLTGQ